MVGGPSRTRVRPLRRKKVGGHFVFQFQALPGTKQSCYIPSRTRVNPLRRDMVGGPSRTRVKPLRRNVVGGHSRTRVKPF